MPLGLVLVILLAAFGVMLVQCKRTLASFVELALPNVLRVFFVLYPLVTNAAFEAFPVHKFSDPDQEFLKVSTGTRKHS